MTAHRFRSARRAAATGAVLTAAVLVLAGCGSQDQAGHDGHAASEPSATAESSGYNSADVTFAQGMIPHHRQAVEMAALVTDRSASPEVKKLATAIEKAQNPEIRTMSGWLESWGEKVPGAGQGSGHSGHSGHGMAGMMSAEDMTRLEKSSGSAFDRAFLEMMIEHHRGAVEMART